MELSKIITPDRICVPMAARDKSAAITELVNVLAATGDISRPQDALQAVLKREAERTTGIGYGLAIPHGKTDACKTLLMSAGKPAEPIDFQSLDGRPVTFIVLLISPPDQTGAHIQALAKVSRLMNMETFRSAVARVSSPRELHDAIAAHEGPEAAAKTT